MNKSLHYSITPVANDDGSVMVNFFAFVDGKLQLGSCESVKPKDMPAYRAHLEAGGWRVGTYVYDKEGRACLDAGVPAVSSASHYS